MTPTQQAASDAFLRALALHNPFASLFHSLSPEHREMMEELLREYVRHWRPTQPRGENMSTEEKQDSKDMATQVVDLLSAHGCFVQPTTSPQSRRMYHDLRQLLARHMEELVRAQAVSEAEGRTRARVFLLGQMEDASVSKAERMNAAAMLLSGG